MLVIELDMSLYPRIEAIQWFSKCGEVSRPQFGVQVRWAEDRTAALRSMFSSDWASASTCAQGRLTGYLARSDYDAYGSQWSEVFGKSLTLLKESCSERMSVALEEGGWPASLARTSLPEITAEVRASIGKRMADLIAAKAWVQCLHATVLLDINLAAVEVAYRRRFPKAPIFFEHLLQVYEAGHLPCGWDGDLDDWPNGELIVY